MFVTSLLALSWVAQLVAATSTSTPYSGITHIRRTESLPRPVSMHIVRVNLQARGLRFTLTAPGGTRETVRQTTREFIKQQKAQLAINVHFFVPFPSQDINASLVGLAASNGNVYSACEVPAQSYAIVARAPALNIDRKNRASIVQCDSPGGDSLFNVLSGSALIITNGVKTIPVYRDADHPEGLLTPGGPGNYSNQKSWYDVPNARTVAGLSRDARTLFLFTVDRAAGSQGLTLSEVTDLLLHDYAVHNALNLDGGGSTTLALQDPVTRQYAVVNKPSDPRGRAVASSLAIYAADARTFWQRLKSLFRSRLNTRTTTTASQPRTLAFSRRSAAGSIRLQPNVSFIVSKYRSMS
jgi:hypothetical protein